MYIIDLRNWKTPGLIFGTWVYFWPGTDKFEFGKKFHTFDEVMKNCHIFESFKNHLNAYISHPKEIEI